MNSRSLFRVYSHRDFSGRTPLPPGSRDARDERSECGATASTTNHRKTTSHRDFSGRTPLPPGSRAARDERANAAQLQHPNAGYFPQAPSTTPLPHPEVATKFVRPAQNPQRLRYGRSRRVVRRNHGKMPEAPATQADSIKRRLRIITGPPFAVSHDPTE